MFILFVTADDKLQSDDLSKDKSKLSAKINRSIKYYRKQKKILDYILSTKKIRKEKK